MEELPARERNGAKRAHPTLERKIRIPDDHGRIRRHRPSRQIARQPRVQLVICAATRPHVGDLPQRHATNRGEHACRDRPVLDDLIAPARGPRRAGKRRCDGDKRNGAAQHPQDMEKPRFEGDRQRDQQDGQPAGRDQHDGERKQRARHDQREDAQQGEQPDHVPAGSRPFVEIHDPRAPRFGWSKLGEAGHPVGTERVGDRKHPVGNEIVVVAAPLDRRERRVHLGPRATGRRGDIRRRAAARASRPGRSPSRA